MTSTKTWGGLFDPYRGVRSKMAALPLPAAILDDLICGTENEVIQDGRRKRKGRHLAPHSSMGVEKAALYYWHPHMPYSLRYTYSVYSQWTERNPRNVCNIFKKSFKYLSRVSIVYFLISFTLHSLSWIDMHIQDRRRFLTYFLSRDVCKTPFAIVLMNHYCVTFWGGCEISSSSDAEKATRFMVAMHMFEAYVHHRVPWTLLSDGYPMVMVKWEKWF